MQNIPFFYPSNPSKSNQNELFPLSRLYPLQILIKMPKIEVSLKHLNSDLTPFLSRVHFLKEFTSQATDLRFESGCVANISRLSVLNTNFKLLEASLRRMLVSDVQRVQFVLMDDANVGNNLEINELCYRYSVQLMLCWGSDDLVKYIESFAERPEVVQSRIKRRQALNPAAILALVPKISSTDAVNLLKTFGSLKGVGRAAAGEYKVIRGISEGKAEALTSAIQGQLLP